MRNKRPPFFGYALPKKKDACTCRPVVMHTVGCPVVSPHGVCEFCKESRDRDGSCSCQDAPALVAADPADTR